MSRRIFAIIAAAGRGRRMGRLKQLLPLGEGTMLDALMNAVLESPIDGLCLVTVPQVADRYEENPADALFVELNLDPASEMLDSIHLGFRRLDRECGLMPEDALMILPGDQPQITAGIIATCAEAWRQPRKAPAILIATYRGRRGHPACYAAARLRETLGWHDGRGLNALARQHPELVRELPITTAAMPIDVNTPEDYDRLRGGR